MVYFFIKFLNEERYVDGFLDGHVYMNRLSYYKKIERNDEDANRADKHEGAFAWLQPGVGSLTINGQDITGDLAGPIEMYDDSLNHINVFCLYAAHSGNLDSNMLADNIEVFKQQIKVPEDCLKLGKHAVFITDPPKFLQRMKSAAESQGYQIGRGLVKYYDPETFHGNFPNGHAIFNKQIQYQYQREYRFGVDTGHPGDDPIILEVGDIRDITLHLNTADLNEALMNVRVRVDP